MTKRNTPDTVSSQNLDNLGSLVLSISERKHLIADALEFTGGTHTLDDIVAMIVSGRLHWWPLENSFMITEVVSYPQAKHLNVFLAGGDLNEIKLMNEALKNTALTLGCECVILSGRRGWVKALSDIGWKESHTTMFIKAGE